MAATTLFSTPISPNQYQKISNQNLTIFGSKRLTRSSVVFIRATSTVEKQEEESSSDEPISSIPIGGCKACGKAEIEKGCNGEGRIQGGIATVPGFGWWPIKAYRPCPDFVATGGRYRRQGQSMDEVAGFGTVPTTSPVTTQSQLQSESSKKKLKGGKRKFKR